MVHDSWFTGRSGNQSETTLRYFIENTAWEFIKWQTALKASSDMKSWNAQNEKKSQQGSQNRSIHGPSSSRQAVFQGSLIMTHNLWYSPIWSLMTSFEPILNSLRPHFYKLTIGNNLWNIENSKLKILFPAVSLYHQPILSSCFTESSDWFLGGVSDWSS